MKMKSHFLILVLTLASVKGLSLAEERILGGDVVELSVHPYATALLTNGGSGSQYSQACGGTIITNNAILSAASCFYTDGIADQVGWWRARIGSADSTRGGTIHFIRQITAHPQFSPTARTSDIAILKTTLNMALASNGNEVARIAGNGLSLSTNQPIVAIGWGLTSNGGQPSEQLREVQFFVVDQQTCANRYALLGFTVDANMVCTGWLDVGVFAQCQGDSGSPILLRDGVVVGVNSWVEGCGDGWYPAVNTLVGPFSSWIISTAIAD